MVRFHSVLLVLFGIAGPMVAADDKAVTFFVTSDSHYEATRILDRNDRNRVTIERMNAIPGTPWPEKLGGGMIAKPSGVLLLGDVIDLGDRRDESAVMWRNFEKQFGIDGTDALLKYPVYEGWGNHDGPPIGKEKFGFSMQAQLKQRNSKRKQAGRITNVAENGLHYSWDWNGIHFIMANLYPADKQHDKVRYSLPWHDPQFALQFIKDDLKAHVGDSNRPVIVLSHCGVDTDWWHKDDGAEFYKAVKPYNMIGYFYGHSGTGFRTWKPEGENKPLDCINTGQTEKEFFAVKITSMRMRLAYQIKKDPKALENIEWEWKFLLDKPLKLGK